MSKGGRKGRISNELVAASCAAILAVYASGYLRTREEARRLGSEAEARRPVRPVQEVPTLPVSAPVTHRVGESQPAVKVVAAAAPPTPTPVQSQTIAAPVPTKPADVAPAPVAIELGSGPEPVVDAVIVAEETPEAPALPVWRDGYYTGWGQSRHGDIEAHLTIKEGRIVDAGILSCETRYPCSVIDSILSQPVEFQSPDVDKVSRATVSANAYYWGLVEALKKAEIAPAVPAAAQ